MPDLIPGGTECHSKKHDAKVRVRSYRVAQGEPNAGVAPNYMLAEVELLEDSRKSTWEADPFNDRRQIEVWLKAGAITNMRSTSLERLP